MHLYVFDYKSRGGIFLKLLRINSRKFRTGIRKTNKVTLIYVVGSNDF